MDKHPAEIVLERLLEYAKKHADRAAKFYNQVHYENKDSSERERGYASGQLHEANVTASIVELEIGSMKRGMARPPGDLWCKWCGMTQGRHMADCERPADTL